MLTEHSAKTRDLLQRLNRFFDEHIYPNEARHHGELDTFRRAGNPWQPVPVVNELKVLARKSGLWNMFLPHAYKGEGGISNLDYAPLCEVMGRVPWSSEVFNCSAPDTGNMETLERYATDAQKARWLEPLLAGEIRSAFLMTEPAVASSDATNIQCSIRRDGDHYVIDGRKWFSSQHLSLSVVLAQAACDDPVAEARPARSATRTPGLWGSSL
jgi:acyl-CoA dehydrogenase